MEGVSTAGEAALPLNIVWLLQAKPPLEMRRPPAWRYIGHWREEVRFVEVQLLPNVQQPQHVQQSLVKKGLLAEDWSLEGGRVAVP